MKFRTTIAIAAALLLSAAVRADDAPAPQGFSQEECARHCKDMAAQKQKMMDEHRKASDEMQAAWRDIEAELDIARKAKGEKKTDALIIALDRLVAAHRVMSDHMPAGPGGLPGGMAGMACCGGMHDMHEMSAMGMDCCAKMAGGMSGMGMSCCAGKHDKAMMGKDCPMMKDAPATEK